MENQIIAKVHNNVLRVERDELANSYEFYPQCSELNNIGVLSVEYDLPILKKLGYTFSPEHVNPTVGDTYIRDPFNKKHFIRIEDFTEEVIKVKQNCILRIVALLGAKDIELSVNVIRKERHVNGKGRCLASTRLHKHKLTLIDRKPWSWLKSILLNRILNRR